MVALPSSSTLLIGVGALANMRTEGLRSEGGAALDVRMLCHAVIGANWHRDPARNPRVWGKPLAMIRNPAVCIVYDTRLDPLK